jgi:hypothetical protein
MCARMPTRPENNARALDVVGAFAGMATTYQLVAEADDPMNTELWWIAVPAAGVV